MMLRGPRVTARDEVRWFTAALLGWSRFGFKSEVWARAGEAREPTTPGSLSWIAEWTFAVWVHGGGRGNVDDTSRVTVVRVLGQKLGQPSGH